MAERDLNLPSKRKPLVLIPVTAEDAERRKLRIRFAAIGAPLILLAIAGFLYKRYTDPLNARESFDAGSRLFKIARYNQAILSFDRAVALDPDFADAYLMRGQSYQQDSKSEEAMRDFTKVTELRPNDPAGWASRAALYLDLYNYGAAIADASQAIALDPKRASVYNLRGVAYRKNGDLKRSLDDLNHAVALDPSADNFSQRGATYQALGEHQNAIADFDQVIAIIPDLGAVFFARAASRRALGDLKGAEEDHERGRILDGR